MAEAVLLVDKQDGYRVLTLNRPKQLNAFDAALHGAMRAALDEIEADRSCRAVLLTGAGRAFCAGADLLQVYTGFIYGGPVWLAELHAGLARRARDGGFASISDAVGCAARNQP